MITKVKKILLKACHNKIDKFNQSFLDIPRKTKTKNKNAYWSCQISGFCGGLNAPCQKY